MTKTGKCLCGSVTFVATPENSEVGICHCSMCRKQNAGPYLAIGCGDSLTITSDADLGIYNSSEWGQRGFCKKCGSSLFWRTTDGSMNVVSVDAFDNLGEVVLHHEIFIDEKPGYYNFSEETQKMTGAQVMAMFSGEGEK